MKKLYIIFCLILFSISSHSNTNSPLKRDKNSTLFLEFNFLANNLNLKYDRLIKIGKQKRISYALGFNSMYKKTNYILPPNIGFPLEFNFLYGKKNSFIETGLTLTPHLIFSKNYTHYNKNNFEEILEENTTLLYLTPHIGIRSYNRLIHYKISIGPRIKLKETSNVYIGRIFEHNKYLELFYFQFSVGFPL